MLNPNYNKHADVNRLINFINAAKIISMKQALCFLESLGLDEERTKNVLNILKKSNKANFTDNKEFLAINPVYLNNASKYFADLRKTSWVYIALAKKFNIVNFDCKYPCKAFLLNTESGNSLHIFEIRNSFLDDDCIHIDTNFSTPNAMKSPIKSIILIENIDDIDNIFLSKGIGISAFAMLNSDENGNVNVRFFDKNKEELQVIWYEWNTKK